MPKITKTENEISSKKFSDVSINLKKATKLLAKERKDIEDLLGKLLKGNNC